MEENNLKNEKALKIKNEKINRIYKNLLDALRYYYSLNSFNYLANFKREKDNISQEIKNYKYCIEMLIDILQENYISVVHKLFLDNSSYNFDEFMKENNIPKSNLIEFEKNLAEQIHLMRHNYISHTFKSNKPSPNASVDIQQTYATLYSAIQIYNKVIAELDNKEKITDESLQEIKDNIYNGFEQLLSNNSHEQLYK